MKQVFLPAEIRNNSSALQMLKPVTMGYHIFQEFEQVEELRGSIHSF